MSFPATVYLLRRPDGTLVIYESEDQVGAPTDSYAELGTYVLSESGTAKRVVNVILDRKDTVKTDIGTAIEIVDGK